MIPGAQLQAGPLVGWAGAWAQASDARWKAVGGLSTELCAVGKGMSLQKSGLLYIRSSLIRQSRDARGTWSQRATSTLVF